MQGGAPLRGLRVMVCHQKSFFEVPKRVRALVACSLKGRPFLPYAGSTLFRRFTDRFARKVRF